MPSSTSIRARIRLSRGAADCHLRGAGFRVVEGGDEPAGKSWFGSTAAVVELHRGPGSGCPDAVSQPGQPRQVLLGPNAELTGPGPSGVSIVGSAGLHHCEPALPAGHQPLVLLSDKVPSWWLCFLIIGASA
jgi:hypothetical protein